MKFEDYVELAALALLTVAVWYPVLLTMSGG